GPPPRQSAAHPQARSLPLLVLLHLARNGGAWAYQRHVAAEDVPQLRPLVDRELAQIAADRRQARIVGDLERRRPPVEVCDARLQFFGIVAHRPEFIERELPPIEPAALLPENH